MEQESGTTSVSLENGQRLKILHGAVSKVQLVFDVDGAEWYQTHVTYQDGYVYVFTGFSWGYFGEGPQGLATWARENSVFLVPSEISRLSNVTSGVIWEWENPEKG